MDRTPVKLGGKLDATDQFDPGLACQGYRPVVTGERVVVGDAEHVDSGAHRLVDQVGGRIRTVRLVRVGMKID